MAGEACAQELEKAYGKSSYGEAEETVYKPEKFYYSMLWRHWSTSWGTHALCTRQNASN